MGNDDSAGREFDEGCNCQTIRLRPRGQKECRLGYPTRCKANMAPLRIACFHSFRMSSGCLRKQMSEFSNFAASLGEQVEFRYLDAPHRCPPEKEAQMPERLKTLLPPPYFEWWNARESDDGAVSYDGEAATLAHVTDFMQREGTSPARAPLRLYASAPLHLRTSLRQARSMACLASVREAAWRTCCAWCRSTTRPTSMVKASSRSCRSLLSRPPGTRGFGPGLLSVVWRSAQTPVAA